MAMTVGQASADTGLAGEIKAAIAQVRPLNTDKDRQFAEKLSDAIAGAVISHLITNMQVDPLGTPIGPPDAVA